MTQTQASASLRLTVSDFTLQTGALLPVSTNGQEFADSAVEPGDGIGFQRFPGNAPSGSLSEIYCGIVSIMRGSMSVLISHLDFAFVR